MDSAFFDAKERFKMGFIQRVKSGWNAFLGRDPTKEITDITTFGSAHYLRPDRTRFTGGNERTIITAVYNRIALDAAAILIQHVRLDENDQFTEVVDSGLNNCLNLEANVDQTGRAFRQDAVSSLLDEGCIALVPVDTSANPNLSTSYDIYNMRVGKIVTWYPNAVKVNIYNEKKGIHEDVTCLKRNVAIVENPFYAVMNEPNSTMQRLRRKLALLDGVDEEASSKKLNMIIQLPYIIKTEARRKQAEKRRAELEEQLTESEYGIAYTDGTEKITQLGRPLENNLLDQIKYLTDTLYGQLGLTPEILNGTADEKTMQNYYDRTIEPIVSAFVDEMKRKFLTKTARTQGQSIMYYMDPFKLVPVSSLAEIADKLTRNEIMSSNEFRTILGMKPSSNPKADELINSNMPVGDTGVDIGGVEMGEGAEGEMPAEGSYDPNAEPDPQIQEIIDQQYENYENQ